MDWDETLKKELKALEDLSKYSFILGVIQNEAPKRKNKVEEVPNKKPGNKEKEEKKKKKEDVTNADLLFLHEFGSPTEGVPKRPILNLTIKRSQQIINKCIDKCIDLIMDGKSEEVMKQLKITAMRIESIARKAIYDGTTGFKPLSITTTRAKKSSLPLLDTGQLARSIVCRVIKK